MNTAWKNAAVVGTLLAVVSCGFFSAREPYPEWIEVVPREAGYLYAYGVYSGSLNPNDNFKNAVTDALGKLALSLRSNVQAAVVVRYVGADFSATSDTSVSSNATVVNAELLRQWPDRQGVVSNPGSVWVLMRVRQR